MTPGQQWAVGLLITVIFGIQFWTIDALRDMRIEIFNLQLEIARTQ